jgi:hypothetical protein
MQVGASALAYTPFGGSGGPGTPPTAYIEFLGVASGLTDPPAAPGFDITLVGYAPWELQPATISIEGIAPSSVQNFSTTEITLEAPLGNYLETRVFPPFLVFSGYITNEVTIPIADLPGLTAEEADPVTGDWRKIVQSIFLASLQHEEPIPWSSIPKSYSIFKYDLYGQDQIQSHFLIKFFTNPISPEVAAEP